MESWHTGFNSQDGKKGNIRDEQNVICCFSSSCICLTLFLCGCSVSRRESSKDPVGLSDASVGDIVVFGDIRWYVIARSETGYTLLCEKPVIKMAFNETGYHTTGTWEDSTVRTWLNEKFYNTFTGEEKALIEKTHNINPDNSEYGTPGGNDTDDYIFQLSVEEALTGG